MTTNVGQSTWCYLATSLHFQNSAPSHFVDTQQNAPGATGSVFGPRASQHPRPLARVPKAEPVAPTNSRFPELRPLALRWYSIERPLNDARPKWLLNQESWENTMSVSDALWEANRRNAARSTGPKTPEGKAASSKNAIKHGLTAVEVLLPNEDPVAYNARLQTWFDFDQPTDPGHVAAIERLVYTQIRLDRCTRHETETTKERILHAADRFDADALASAYALGRRLIDDPIVRAPEANAPKQVILE